MKKIFFQIILMITVSTLLLGCNNKTSLSKEEIIKEVSYNWLDDNTKFTIIDWKNANIETIKYNEEHLVVNKEKTLDIINKEVLKVTFTSEDDELLGPVVVYLDKDTLEVIGMDFRL